MGLEFDSGVNLSSGTLRGGTGGPLYMGASDVVPLATLMGDLRRLTGTRLLSGILTSRTIIGRITQFGSLAFSLASLPIKALRVRLI